MIRPGEGYHNGQGTKAHTLWWELEGNTLLSLEKRLTGGCNSSLPTLKTKVRLFRYAWQTKWEKTVKLKQGNPWGQSSVGTGTQRGCKISIHSSLRHPTGQGLQWPRLNSVLRLLVQQTPPKVTSNWFNDSWSRLLWTFVPKIHRVLERDD